jgi:hypothetical protein
MNVDRVNSNGRYSVHYRPYAGQLKVCCLVTHCANEPLGRKVTTTLSVFISTDCVSGLSIQTQIILINILDTLHVSNTFGSSSGIKVKR